MLTSKSAMEGEKEQKKTNKETIQSECFA